jgi:tetratricopeptide (TPR) repeat protein
MDRIAKGEPNQRLRSLTARATIAQQSQDHEAVITSVEQAFDVALEIDASAEQLFRLSHLLASVDLRSGDLVTARDRWMMIAGDAQRSGSVAWEMLTRSTAAGADLQLGEFDAAESGCKHGLVLARGLSDYSMELHLRFVLAALEALRDRSDIAIEQLQEVVDETTERGSLRILSHAAVTLGEVQRHRGDFDEAQRHLERAERLFRATGQRVSLSRCLAERAQTALAMGELTAAGGFAAGAGLAASLASGVLLGQERIYCALGKVAEAQGDRQTLAAARQATLACLDSQAARLGPEHLGPWASVGHRMEVVTWVGWNPKC